MIDRCATQNKGREILERRCQEFKKRGELSIKILRDQENSSDQGWVQTARRLTKAESGKISEGGNSAQSPTLLQVKGSASLPPPPSPGRIPKKTPEVPVLITTSSMPRSLAGGKSGSQQDLQVVPNNRNQSPTFGHQISQPQLYPLNHSEQTSGQKIQEPFLIAHTATGNKQTDSQILDAAHSSLEKKPQQMLLTLLPSLVVRPTITPKLKQLIIDDDSGSRKSSVNERYTEKWINPSSASSQQQQQLFAKKNANQRSTDRLGKQTVTSSGSRLQPRSEGEVLSPDSKGFIALGQNSLNHSLGSNGPIPASPTFQIPEVQRVLGTISLRKPSAKDALNIQENVFEIEPDLATPQNFKSEKKLFLDKERAVSPSPFIRILSQGTHMMSSGFDEGLGVRESMTSQILIRDEIVSKFNEGESKGSINSHIDVNSQSPLGSMDKGNVSSEQRITSPPAERAMNRALVSIETIMPSPPEQTKPREIDDFLEYPDPEPPVVRMKKPATKSPAVADLSLETDERLDDPKPPIITIGDAVNIDFSRLTSEDKSCAIADFILENLIMEVFTSSPRLRDRLTDTAKRVSTHKLNRPLEEISQYLSTVFSVINESPEEQLDIFTRLNTPIIHTDLNRLLMASPPPVGGDPSIANQLNYESVLSIQLYIRIEEELRDTDYIDRGLSPNEVEREHIFHKLLFDALNEKLDYARIGGLNGTPPCFFSAYKPLPKISPSECARILEQSKRDVMEWAMEHSGLLPENFKPATCFDTTDSNTGEALEAVREESLLRHLNQYTLSVEEKWGEISDEILEVFLGLSDYVFDTLVEGTVASMVSIKRKRSSFAPKKGYSN